MNKLFFNFGIKNYWSFDENGVNVVNSSGEKLIVAWDKIHKISFVDYFEEYSGYFLTDEYINKATYNDIRIDCNKNSVRIRTGSTPVVRRNTSNAFTTKHGTACVEKAVFVEYLNNNGDTNLYVEHFEKLKKSKQINELTKYLPADKICKQKRVDGFNHLASIQKHNLFG